ncbi:MAG TPA: multicopper oxidase domain-containing protein [Nevskiaceae bacterium]
MNHAAVKRRQVLKLGSLTAFGGAVTDRVAAARQQDACDAGADRPADYAMRIAPGTVELDPKVIVSTTLCNGRFPGPILSVAAGKRVVVEVENRTAHVEEVAWHGQFLRDGVDAPSRNARPASSGTAGAVSRYARTRRACATITR